MVDKYGAEAAFVPAALLNLCDKSLSDFPLTWERAQDHDIL